MNKRMQQNKRMQRHESIRNFSLYRPPVRDTLRRWYRVRVYTILTYSLVLAGCAQSPKHREASYREDRLTAQPSTPLALKVQDSTLNTEQSRDIGIANMMEVAEDVLTKMHFMIEKADVKNGLIRTRPLPGAQFFEFWRSDNIGAENILAANLHTIRRTVTLNISPVPAPQGVPDGRAVQGSRQDKQLRIACEVHAERLSLPEQQVSSSAGIYGMFSKSSPSLQRLQINPEQKKQMEWIDMGRDPKLEAEIIKRIEKQIIQQTNQQLQTMENQI